MPGNAGDSVAPHYLPMCGAENTVMNRLIGALPSWNLWSNSNSLLPLIARESQKNLYIQEDGAYALIGQDVVVREKEESEKQLGSALRSAWVASLFLREGSVREARMRLVWCLTFTELGPTGREDCMTQYLILIKSDRGNPEVPLPSCPFHVEN